jgi:hypothetical protein
MHPVGPQSPGTYWLRRLLVLAVVVALLLGIRWLLVGGDEEPTASGTQSPSPSASPTSTAPDASGSPTATPTASPTTSPTATAAPGPDGQCADAAISVTATTDAASYTVGSTPRLRMRIENTSGKACKRDVGAAQNELVITSGSTRVWSSDDCNPGGDPNVVTLEPGQSYSVSVTWLGRLSQKGCPADQPLAEAGTYKLTGRNGEVTSEPAVFALTAG